MKYLAPLFLVLMSGCAGLVPKSDPEAMVLAYGSGEALIRMADIEYQICKDDALDPRQRLTCAVKFEDRLESINSDVAVVTRYKEGFFAGLFDGVSGKEFSLAQARLLGLKNVLSEAINLNEYEVLQ